MISPNEDPWEISMENKKAGCKAEAQTVTALQINPCENPAMQNVHREPALNTGLMLRIHKKVFVPSHKLITLLASSRGSI